MGTLVPKGMCRREFPPRAMSVDSLCVLGQGWTPFVFWGKLNALDHHYTVGGSSHQSSLPASPSPFVYLAAAICQAHPHCSAVGKELWNVAWRTRATLCCDLQISPIIFGHHGFTGLPIVPCRAGGRAVLPSAPGCSTDPQASLSSIPIFLPSLPTLFLPMTEMLESPLSLNRSLFTHSLASSSPG